MDIEPPRTLVRFVYLGDDGKEHLDTQFDAFCSAVPRVGERIVPDSGSGAVVVHAVYHRFVPVEELDDTHPFQAITVLLREIRTPKEGVGE